MSKRFTYCITDDSCNIVSLDGQKQAYSFAPCLSRSAERIREGRRRNATTWTYNNVPQTFLFDRGFTGHEHLDVFGLINMNGRAYDSWLGRFLSMDPTTQGLSSTQNYNRYTYALNNPLKYTDPTGYNNENSGAIYINPYAFPGYQGYIGPGSGNYWTDYVRTEYGNYMLMSSSTFNHFYGEGSTDIAGQITSNPTALEKWKDGGITLSMIRRDGGFWVDYSWVNNITYDFGNGAENLQEVDIISRWVPVGSAGGDVIEFIQLKEKCNKHEALKKATEMISPVESEEPFYRISPTEITPQSIQTQAELVVSEAEPPTSKAEKTELLEKLFAYFRTAVYSSHPAKNYAQGNRGINIYETEVGYNSAQFHHGKRKDMELINQCVKYGVLTPTNVKTKTGAATGYIVYAKNCLIFPLKNREQKI